MVEEEKQKSATIGVTPEVRRELKIIAAKLGMSVKGLVTELVKLEGISIDDGRGIKTVGDYMPLWKYAKPGVSKREWALEGQQKWMRSVEPRDLAYCGLTVEELEAFERVLADAIKMLKPES